MQHRRRQTGMGYTNTTAHCGARLCWGTVRCVATSGHVAHGQAPFKGLPTRGVPFYRRTLHATPPSNLHGSILRFSSHSWRCGPHTTALHARLARSASHTHANNAAKEVLHTGAHGGLPGLRVLAKILVGRELAPICDPYLPLPDNQPTSHRHYLQKPGHLGVGPSLLNAATSPGTAKIIACARHLLMFVFRGAP